MAVCVEFKNCANTDLFIPSYHMTNEEQTDLYFYLSNISFKE